MARSKKDRNIISDAARLQLDAYIQAMGMRRTPERYAVLEHIVGLDNLFTAEEVISAMDSPVFRVCQATVYNTIQTLCDAEILRKHYYDGNHISYELALSAKGNVHLICRVCGSIKVSHDPEIDAMLRHRRFTAFSHRYYSLHIYGICSRCQRSHRRNGTNADTSKHKTT